jgi:uncharacterized protein involved in exopolysaccharide biosynthesis
MNQDVSKKSLFEEARKSFDLVEFTSIIWQRKKLITYIVGISIVLSIVISLLLPEYFKSTAVLLPQTEKGKLSGGTSDLTDLASIAGINTLGEGSIVKLYPAIIKSESVLKNVLYAKYKTMKLKDSVNLIKFLGIEAKTPALIYENALNALRDALEVTIENRTYIVTISTETREPQLSSDIVNRVVFELDRFIRTKRTANASEQRKWIEIRLDEVKHDLEKSENTLKEFRERNRIVVSSPQLLLEQERLLREVQINSIMYIELKKQFEIVKIEEIKNLRIINILDDARPAVKKDKPKRSNVVGITFAVSLLMVLLYIIIEYLYKRKFIELISKLNIRLK